MPKDQSQLPMELQVMKKCQGKDQGSDEFFQKKGNYLFQIRSTSLGYLVRVKKTI